MVGGISPCPTSSKGESIMTTRGLFSLATDSKRKRAGSGRKTVGAGKRVGTDPKILNQSWLRTSMNSHREDKRPLWGNVKTGGWHPSSLGKVCDRQSILGMFGYRGDHISQTLSRIFAFGNKVEDLWREDFAKMGILLAANQRIQDPGPPPINGEYDVLLKHPYEPNRRLLGEIKSINDAGFKQLPPLTLDPAINFEGLQNLKSRVGDRVRGYLVQVMFYMRITKVHEGFLLFDNKNDSEYNDYYLVYNEEYMAPKVARIIRLEEYRPKLIVPPCTCLGKHEGLCLYRPEEEVPLTELKEISGELDVV